jgi:hypothetical protein
MPLLRNDAYPAAGDADATPAERFRFSTASVDEFRLKC